MNANPPVRPVPPSPSIALFGATGFIGQQVYASLTQRGATVVTIRTPRIETALDYSRAVRELPKLMSNVDAVINAAGLAKPDADSTLLQAANSDVPRLLAEVCETLSIRLVHVSSAAVLGSAPVLDSSTDTQPFSPYSKSKSDGEAHARGWRGSVIYRPAGVHGPERTTTETLAKFARSPFSSVSGDGSQTTPQALAPNVADAIAFLAMHRDQPPQIVHHPDENLSATSLLAALGGRDPVHLPGTLTKLIVRLTNNLGRYSAKLAANSRRLDVLWHGQPVANSWLEIAGWKPPVNADGWVVLGETLTTKQGPTVVFGVTSGLSAPPFFEGLFAYLRVRGWEVSLIASREGNVETFTDSEGANFLPVETVRRPSPWSDLKTLAHVIRHLRDQRPHVAVWGTPKMGLLGVLASRLTNTPSVYVVHGLRYQGASGYRRRLLRTIEAIPIALASETFAVGYDIKECLEMDRVAKPGKVQVHANGSANGILPANQLSSIVGMDDAPISATFVGRLTKDKGLVVLLEAWKVVRRRDPNATLHLYGRRESDAWSGSLAALLDTTDGVLEHGFVEDTTPVYESAMMLLLPTRREGLPTVVLEAAAAGVPTIAANVPGAREPIDDDCTGLLIEPENSDALAEAVLRLGLNPSYRLQLGEAARRHVIDRYSRDTVHRSWGSTLSSYVSQRHSDFGRLST